MNIDSIKEYEKIVKSFGLMEMAVLDTKLNISLECSLSNISHEMLNDLNRDLTNLAEGVKAHPVEYREVNRVINESFTLISKYKRLNESKETFERKLDDMLLEFINMRKTVLFSGDTLYESYVEDLQYIYDNYVSEATSAVLRNEVRVTGLMEGIGAIMTNIKTAFSSKHDKIVARDKQWLKDNKKKFTSMSYDDIELEVPSDYKVTFASLINHHDIFEKNCKGDNASDKIARFEDKNGNLKNGLDNYYRTGSSKREIGLRKVSGSVAKEVVTAMLTYCNDFLSGKKYIEDKLDAISKEVEEEEPVKESVIYEADEPDVDKELEDIDKEDNEDVDNEEDITAEDEGKNKDEVKDETKSNTEERSVGRDRQTGITVLMTIAEERYFDYIEILKSLAE